MVESIIVITDGRTIGEQFPTNIHGFESKKKEKKCVWLMFKKIWSLKSKDCNSLVVPTPPTKKKRLD